MSEIKIDSKLFTRGPSILMRFITNGEYRIAQFRDIPIEEEVLLRIVHEGKISRKNYETLKEHTYKIGNGPC